MTITSVNDIDMTKLRNSYSTYRKGGNNYSLVELKQIATILGAKKSGPKATLIKNITTKLSGDSSYKNIFMDKLPEYEKYYINFISSNIYYI